MASGLVFDPIRLLRVAPLASSTASLIYATTELIVNNGLLQPEIRPASNRILPRWYSYMFHRGIWIVVGLNMTTVWSSIASLWLDSRRSNARPSSPFYWVGLAGAVGHLLFVPWVATPIQNMVEDRNEQGATCEMEKWLSVHRVRMLVADLPAWLAFVAAIMTTSL
ncbi:putative integral membrane protein [Aspergillus ambiguus]|uniref:putative integral membrane protein n=1 Tax=Aspergillus ambiguus TaxID=176160 RepID=UPI003CCCBAAA